MSVKFTNGRNEYYLSRAIDDEVQPGPLNYSGKLECLEAKVENLTDLTTRLIEMLLKQNKLTPEQTAEVIGYGWEAIE